MPPIEAILYVLVIFIALMVVNTRNLFAATMLSGIFSLLCTCVYTLTDAVDVAFTEAAVGAGISTVLFLATLVLTGERSTHRDQHRLPAIVVALMVGGALIYGMADLPAYGDPSAVIHHHVAPRFINVSPNEVGMPNFVTSVLASYRGFDTLGETTVVFAAAVGVIVLLTSGNWVGRRVQSPAQTSSGAKK